MVAKLIPKRKRNAAVTRDAILKSARRAFARAGDDGVGLREIAAGAGVTAMLVNRYFGSKEDLFAEVVASTMADPVILTAETLAALSGDKLAAALVEMTKEGATPLDGFLIMHRSGSSERAAKIGRAEIEKRYQKILAPALGGSDAQQRAAILISLVAGFQIMRQMIGLEALTNAKSKTLVKLLAPLFQLLVDNPR
jgi:AcrR family transcriptional regulator